MGLHRDADEEDFAAPVVSVSLGDTAIFRIGGLERGGKTETLKLSSGDVVVMGGPSRLRYHGIDRILAGSSTADPRRRPDQPDIAKGHQANQDCDHNPATGTPREHPDRAFRGSLSSAMCATIDDDGGTLMLRVIIGLVLILFGAQAFLRRSSAAWHRPVPAGRFAGVSDLFRGPLVGIVMVIAGFGFLASTSFVQISADKVGHLKRIYLADDLPPGRIIALPGQKGPQAELLGPGFHFRPLAQRPLRGRAISTSCRSRKAITARSPPMTACRCRRACSSRRSFPTTSSPTCSMPRPSSTQGGFRGPQETVLKPGAYRLNRYLFDVRIDNDTTATVIPAGQVGVVKSNVQQPGLNCKEELVRVSQAQHDADALSVPLVPSGCIGLWKEPLLPGAYYLNRHAYDVTPVDTRVQTWEYKGGYKRRTIDLSHRPARAIDADRAQHRRADAGNRRRPGGVRQGRGLGHSAGIARGRAGRARRTRRSSRARSAASRRSSIAS